MLAEIQQVQERVRESSRGFAETAEGLDAVAEMTTAYASESVIEETSESREPIQTSEEVPKLKFKDAVGRKFSFPFHLVNKWQVRKRSRPQLSRNIGWQIQQYSVSISCQ